MLLFLETSSQVIKKGGACFFFSHSHTSIKQTPLGPENVSVHIYDMYVYVAYVPVHCMWLGSLLQ